MNPIDTMIFTIMNTIPHELLHMAFADKEQGLTIQSAIQKYVIEDYLWKDMVNRTPGRKKTIALSAKYALPSTYPEPMPMERDQNHYCFYEVPLSAREGRPIVSVGRLTYPMYLGMNTQSAMCGVNSFRQSGTTLESSANDALNSLTFSQTPSAPQVVLVTESIVRIDPPIRIGQSWLMECYLAMPKDFSHITQQQNAVLGDLARYATEAYIYNKLYISMGTAYLQGGMENSRVSTVIERYAESFDKMRELEKKFTGVTALSGDELIALANYMM